MRNHFWEEAHKAFPGMFLKDRNFLSWAMWLEQLRYPAPIKLLKIGNFQSGFLIAKISSWHWTPFSFPTSFGLFSYSKKPKASQPARQPTSKSVHSKTSTWYIGNSHQDEKFPPLWASSKNWPPSMKVKKDGKFPGQKEFNGLHMIQIEWPRHPNPSISSSFKVGRIPSPHY